MRDTPASANTTDVSIRQELTPLPIREPNPLTHQTTNSVRGCRRAQYLDGQLERLDELIVPLVMARAPGLRGWSGAGPDPAAILLIVAGDHPGRLRSEAAWAHLCGTAPIPASSGKVAGTGSTPRGPASQPSPVADRDHPDGLPSADPRLRRPAGQRRPVQEGDHPRHNHTKGRKEPGSAALRRVLPRAQLGSHLRVSIDPGQRPGSLW